MKRAFYDLSVSPLSYDFATFILAANANGCDEVVIVPGTRMVALADGSVFEFQKCSPEEQAYRLKHLMLGLVPEAIVAGSRDHAKTLWHEGCFPTGYTVDQPVHAHMVSHVMRLPGFYPFRARRAYIDRVAADWPQEKLVTITIRESSIKPARNSKIAAWISVATWLVDRGLCPVFVPDTENLYTPFGGHLVCREAALDVQYRLALYDKAHLNMGVNNGPMTIVLFSDWPLLYFKPITPECVETWPAAWALSGIPPGTQPSWFTNRQRIVWEGYDTAKNIRANLKVWLSMEAK